MQLRFAIALACCFLPLSATATPGPDSTVILAASTPGSQAIAAAYAKTRSIPAPQLCTVQVPATDDLSLDDFRSKVLAPLDACIAAASASERIEAVVLMRGLPRRVRIDGVNGAPVVSLAAALAVAHSTLADGKTPLVGQPPGMIADCQGTPCLAAKWSNPYKKAAFDAGFTKKLAGVQHHLWLVTALDGYSDADALALAQRGAAADLAVDPTASFVLMQGADPARAALDGEFSKVSQKLVALGAKAAVVPFAADWQGPSLAGFVVGTASLGKTIENNGYAPGALVDNLTSFGAVPANFVDPAAGGAQVQVSVCRWLRAGATGVHGTVDEPLSNCFPSRQFLADYRSGATLAEAYGRNLPFVYWRNLVLGDPMTAPYATRPELQIRCGGILLGAGDLACQVPAEAPTVQIAADGHGEAVERLRVLPLTGGMTEALASELELALPATATSADWLVVAQFAAGDGPGGSWRSKAWRRLHVERAAPVASGADAGAGSPDASAGTDAGVASADAGVGTSTSVAAGGCTAHRGRLPLAWACLPLFGWAWRRRSVQHATKMRV